MHSIKFRYTSSIFILVASFVIFVVFYFPTQQREQYIEAYEKELDVINETLGLGVAIGLRDDNYESLRFAFDFARSDERLVFVLVTDTSNQTIASFPDDLEVDAEQLANNEINQEKVLVNRSQMHVDDQVYGYIYMAHSLDQLNAIIAASRNQTFFVGSIILLVGLLLAYFVALRLTRPIQLLTTATRALTEGDYQVQANISTKDETGILAAHFNEMAKTIALKTQQLESRAEELSHTVNELERAKDQIQEAHQETELLLSSISSVLIGVGEDGLVSRWNIVAERTFGFDERDVVQRPFEDLNLNWNLNEIDTYFVDGEHEGFTIVEDVTYKQKDGKPGFLQVTIYIVRDAEDSKRGHLILAADTTEKKNLESQLMNAQKLESLGRLAAGIAHEINTPIQFIGDNTRFIQVAFQKLDSVLEKSKELVSTFKEDGLLDQVLDDIEKSIAASKMDYMRREVPFAIEETLDGVTRVSSIVKAMNLFSHPGDAGKGLSNINDALESTINVARNEWKYVADLDTDFDPQLPDVLCLRNELNQVFLNMIINAAHAITPTLENQPDKKGKITISTRKIEAFVEIRIKDNGSGIPEEIRSKVFDPFFTTKEVGKGTGQGLALAYNVVYEKHGGTITIESEVGVGTTFIIRLPIMANEPELPEQF